jgi:hypothetical protein
MVAVVPSPWSFVNETSPRRCSAPYSFPVTSSAVLPGQAGVGVREAAVPDR